MAEKQKDLAKVENGGTKGALRVVDFPVPAFGGDLGDLEEDMDGLNVSMDRVRIPSGGGMAFEVPGEDEDEPVMVTDLTGVIVHHHPVNAYWADPFSGASNPPDCSAMDGKMGIDGSGKTYKCETCPMNQWGSDGAGKACKNLRRVYILREGDVLPLLLALPPTSIKPFTRYVSRALLSRGLRTWQVVTSVKLAKATSRDGITYSQAKFAMIGVLGESAQETMESYRSLVKGMAEGFEAAGDDYATAPAPEIAEPGPVVMDTDTGQDGVNVKTAGFPHDGLPF